VTHSCPTTPEIPLDQIEPGLRYREDYGEIDQLCYDIKKNGLITPIAVGLSDRVTGVLPPGESTERPYVLLAGGRRLRAMTKLGWKTAPVRIYTQKLSELEFRSIELAENFCRKDMTFAEDVALKRKINDLQIAIHGHKHSPTGPGWSQADTAKLINESPATLSKDISLARAIEQFPELGLASCKTKADAMKRLKAVGTTLIRGQAAAAYTEKMDASESPIFKQLSSSYIINDCLEVFKKLPSSSQNFVEIDPPYAIDLMNVKKDNECIGYNEVLPSVYSDLMLKVFQESYRTLKEGGWLVCWFAADPWFQEISDWMRSVGFKMNLIPGIWAKPQGQTAQPETYLGNSYEMFFYARKGQSKLHKPGRSNIFQFAPVPHTQKYHPTQRPIELMDEIFQTFTQPGHSAFVPFLGSGVSLLSAHRNKVNAIGTDLTQSFKDGYILKLKELLG